MSAHLCILGDYDPKMPTHHALDAARNHAALVLSERVDSEWVATDELNLGDLGSRFQGLWVAPGSPYRDEPRVLAALARARTTNLPTFGNCGGFQFMVLEFAQHVVGLADARHEESGGEVGPTIIRALACSLKGQSEVLTVFPGSLLSRLVGAGPLVGRYFCSYGVDPAYAPALQVAGLRWTSSNPDGEPRSFELAGHRFYLGCLFQPALDSAAEDPNPLIVGFLSEVLSQVPVP